MDNWKLLLDVVFDLWWFVAKNSVRRLGTEVTGCDGSVDAGDLLLVNRLKNIPVVVKVNTHVSATLGGQCLFHYGTVLTSSWHHPGGGTGRVIDSARPR